MTARHFFLKGPSGVGKSTLLLSCLKPFWGETDGFFSQRLLDDVGETKGFCLVALKGTSEPPSAWRRYGPQEEGVFLERTKAGFQQHPEVFEGLGEAILDCLILRARCQSPGFCYLDEIGGMELLAAGFMERLKRVLSAAPVCIGVLKSSSNLAAMEMHASTARRLALKRERLELKLEKDLGCRIYSFTGEEKQKEEVKSILKQLLLEGRC